MAKKKQKAKSKPKMVRRRSKGAFCATLAALALLLFFAWMWINAHIIHLRYAEINLKDLPAAFDGTTLLYISDLNIQNASDDHACAKLIKKLSALNVDMLLLGGDYTADSAIEIINGSQAEHSERANGFISSLAEFSAPMGKYAVAGENDDVQTLQAKFASSGVQLLSDACVQVEKNGAQLVIAGLSDVSGKQTPYEEIGSYFTGDECVIALSHNPSAYVGVRVAEARNGGAWADLVLSGHNLGGQIKIGKRTIRTMSDAEARCLAGWYYADDLPLLVSQGLGCKAAKLRLGTQSEIWHITLRRPQNQTLPDF